MGTPIHFREFNSQASSWLGLLFTLIVSSAFVFMTFGLDFVFGTSPYWQTQVDDVTQYIAGFNMYYTAPWQLPLLGFDSLNYPNGTLVTFVDAIPLYSLILKAFLPASLSPFNPFGFWVALSFLLQAVGAWWINRALGTNSWIMLIALLAVLLTFPALMMRLGHISLMSHWIILFSLALYIHSYKQRQLTHWAWTILLVAAFYINIYLFIMASGILLAALFNLGNRIVLRNIFHFSLPFIVISLTTLLMILPLPAGNAGQESGFGFYSMNFLAPLIGGKIFYLQAVQGPGQYEGFNYLGFGILGALAFIFIVWRNALTAILLRHKSLVIVLMLYTVYALSSQIYFGGQKMLEISYPSFLDGVTSQLRASGRFFWPVGYILIIASFFILFRVLSRRAFLFATLSILILQIADIEGIHKHLQITSVKEKQKRLDFTSWDATLGSNVKNIYFYPKFKCDTDPLNTLLPVMLYASERRLNLNTGYIARYRPECNNIQEEIENSEPAISVYVFTLIDYPSLDKIKPFFSANSRVQCMRLEFAHVCKIISREPH